MAMSKSRYLLSYMEKKQRFSILGRLTPHLHCMMVMSSFQSGRSALLLEKKAIMERKRSRYLVKIETSHTYGGIFPETWKLLNIMMALPVGTASVERSFSQMKLIKTCLRSHLSDSNLEYLMKIAINGTQLTDVDFDGILNNLKQKNRRISL